MNTLNSLNDRKSQITLLLIKGNFNPYFDQDKEIIKGRVDHDLSLSSSTELDFVIARKNSLEKWIPEETAFSEALGGFFEEGFKGNEQELLLEIQSNLLPKLEIIKSKERRKYENFIQSEIDNLSALKERLCKASAQTLKNSFVSAKGRESAKSLYQDPLMKLNKLSYILTDEETYSVRTLIEFYDSLTNCETEAGFLNLQQYTKK